MFLLYQCHSKVEKIRRANHSAKQWKICFFCIISTALTETGGGGAIALFYRKTLQVCFWKITILITGSCACIVLVLFSLERESGSEKRNIFLFLIAKICMILVYISSFQRGYVRRCGSNMFEQEKVFQISGVILAAEPSIKSFTFIFLGFCLYFKPAFKIKKVQNTS